MTMSADDLQALQYCADAKDRIGYYSILIKHGDLYARLALDVVTSEAMSGRAANQFFLDQAAREGYNITLEQLASIGIQLMEEDFDARRSGEINISSDATQRYHEYVYNIYYISANAWTPNFVYQTLGSQTARDAYWHSLVSARDWAINGFSKLIAPLSMTTLGATTWSPLNNSHVADIM